MGNNDYYVDLLFYHRELQCLVAINLKKLAELYDIAEEDDNLKPTDVVCGSNKVVYWKCHKCGFQWKLSVIKNIKRKKKCKNCGV